MEKLALQSLLWFVIFLFGLQPAAFCQLEDLPPEEDTSPTTRVKIGDATSVPGETFTVPVYVTPGINVQVGSVKFDVNFISENLKFVRLDRGIVVELGNLELKTDVKTGKNDKDVETTTLTISASLPNADTATEGIARGILGFLILHVSEQGRPAAITLRLTGGATELKSKKPIQDFKAFNATIEVFAPGDRPVVSCFFFTH